MKIKLHLLTTILLFSFLFSFSQKAKSKPAYAYTYSVPIWYITKDYSSYISKINLPKEPVKIFVNNKFHSDKTKLAFNAFFKESLYNTLFSNLNGLTRVKDLSNATILVEANIINPRIDIIIEKKKPLIDYKGKKFETPHKYSYNYSYEIEFKVIDTKENKELYVVKIETNQNHNFSLSKREVFFEKYNDAVKYAINYIDKAQLISDMYKKLMLDLNNQSKIRQDILFLLNKNSFSYLYKVTKPKKHAQIKPFNTIVANFRETLKQTNATINKKSNKITNNNFNKQLKTNKNTQTAYGYELNNDMANSVTAFENKMVEIYKTLDTTDKIEKRIAWSAVINCANAFYLLGDFSKALHYYNLAEKIDYKEDNTKAFKNKMLSKREKLLLFYENDQIKKDVNMIYLGPLKSFKIN